VLARDRPEPTEQTVAALLAQEPPPDVVLLIDNAGTPAVGEVLEAAAAGRPEVEILSLPRNLGCAGGFEAGLRKLLERDDIDLIAGFDDDATPLPGCLAALARAATELPAVGAVGALSHDPAGTLAWPMLPVGDSRPVATVDQARARAGGDAGLAVHSLAWHGLMFPVEVLRRHGVVWGELFLQYEDIELGLRYRAAGLNMYLVPAAECIHPPPPPSRAVTLFGRQIDVTAQNAAKEYLSLRNGLLVRRRHDGLRFWYGTGPFVLLRGLLSALALDLPKRTALRHVLLRGVLDGLRGRVGPPPSATTALSARPRH
jgi:glycosyltransferase involved in cell wall biosynthesis